MFLAKNELGYQDKPEAKEAPDSTIEKTNKQIESLASLINNPVPERTLETIEGDGNDGGGDAA